MCGPISEEMLSLARDELENLLNTDLTSGRSYFMRAQCTLDRLAVHATRIQIETLIEDLKEKDLQLEKAHQGFESIQIQNITDFENLRMEYRDDLHRLKTELKDTKAKLKRSELERLKIIHETEARIRSHRKVPAELTEKYAKIEADVEAKIIKFQARIRGMIIRSKVMKTKVIMSAEQSGVLVALKNTIQGMFFFVFKMEFKIFLHIV